MARAHKPGGRLSWMPWYVDHYLADTTHLEQAEHGAYMLLIAAYWKNQGPLVDDDETLRRTAKATREHWPEQRRILEAFFETGDGTWRHGRIEHELAEAKRVSLVNTENGKAGNDARWKKGRKATKIATAIPNGSQLDPERDPELIASSTITEKKTSPTRVSVTTSQVCLGVGEAAVAAGSHQNGHSPAPKKRSVTPQQARAQAIVDLFPPDGDRPAFGHVGKWLSKIGFERLRELILMLGAKASHGTRFDFLTGCVNRVARDLGADPAGGAAEMSDVEREAMRAMAAAAIIAPSTLEAPGADA